MSSLLFFKNGVFYWVDGDVTPSEMCGSLDPLCYAPPPRSRYLPHIDIKLQQGRGDVGGSKDGVPIPGPLRDSSARDAFDWPPRGYRARNPYVAVCKKETTDEEDIYFARLSCCLASIGLHVASACRCLRLSMPLKFSLDHPHFNSHLQSSR
ncbi:hypothetical protein VTI74DRAFT_3303 [Chaetomium olivicolor]